MQIRAADRKDEEMLSRFDRHIRPEELEVSISLGRVLVAEENGQLAGWLRWNLFWDNTPFMNMLFLLEKYRGQGFGGKMVYRRRHYVDAGALLLPGEPLEIIFVKELIP